MIAIHDRKDGDRHGYYLCMHHMAYKEFTQELSNSSECIRYLCDFGRPTVVQFKNWSAIAQASLDTQAASLRKLQENVFKMEELRFSNQTHNTAFGIEVADRLNSLKRNLTNQQNKLEGNVQDVVRRLLKSLNLDSFWTHSIEERFNKHLIALNILWKKTNHQSQYINDLNSKCMEHNIYLNDVKAWGRSSKGFFEDIYDKIKVIQERMDADTAQFNKLANGCRIVLERQVLSDKNEKIRIARMNKLHDEFDCWLDL